MRRCRISLLVVTALAGLAWAAGCGDGATEPPEPPRPTTLTVTPTTAELTALGATEQLTAEVRDQNGNVMAGAEFSWASSDDAVATVDGSGLVTAADNGTATVTATAGSASGTAAVTVTQVPDSVAVLPVEATIAALGDTLRLAAEAFDANGRAVAGAEFSWASSDDAVATVDGSGLVTAAGSGTATITASVGSASGSAVVTVMQSVASVEVSPAAETIGLGSTLQLTAEGFDENGDAVAGVEFSWESSDDAVATVDATGLVTGVAEGMVTITATSGSAQGTAEISVGPNPDRAALLALYEATDGANWNDGTNWLTDARLGDWYGVEVDDAGRVVALELVNNNLTGAIPPEVGNLSALQRLHLSNIFPVPNLTGPIPAELGNLTALRSLSLRYNGLTGAIPPELSNLTALRYLDLSNNVLTGAIPAELGNLGNLERLHLGGNNLTGMVPPELGNLTFLRDLIMFSNALTGSLPAEIGNLSRLRTLSVFLNGGMTGALPLSLSRLALASFDFSDTGLCIPDSASFRVWLSGIGSMKGTGLECRSVFRAPLEALYRTAGGATWSNSGNWLTDAPLAQWYGVQVDGEGQVMSLDLSDNNLRGSIPGQLGSLSRLQSLNLMNNTALEGRLPLSLANTTLEDFDYSGTGLCVQRDPSFRRWLNGIATHAGTGLECEVFDRDVLEVLYNATSGPNWDNRDNWLTDAPLGEWYGIEVDNQGRVVAVVLSNNDLTGPIPPELGSLAALQVLYVENNNLTGEIPPELGNLTALRYLNVSNNRLTGPIPRELGSLTTLQDLQLFSNDLMGPIPPELGNLTALRSLNVYNNDLMGPIPPELGNLTALRYLNVSNNRLTGPIPRELGSLTTLQDLQLFSNDLMGPIPPELGNLTALRYLNVSNNRLTGPIPRELGSLTTLQDLQLFSNDLMGPIPPELGNLTALRYLNVSNNRLTGGMPPSLARLTGLERLAAGNNTQLSGTIPDELTGLRQLAGLHFDGTGLCAPRTMEFQDWLDGILSARVLRCDNVDMPFYLTQAVQSLEFPVPLVAGEDALLRVFVAGEDAASHGIPRIRATFFRGSGSEPIHVADIPAQDHPIPAAVNEGDLSASANAQIPGDVIVPGLEIVVEVDPDSRLDPALGITRRIPAAGRTAVDVRTMPTFDLTVVPLQQLGNPDRSFVNRVAGLTTDSETFFLLRKLLPVGEFNLTIREPLMVSNEPIARYCLSFLPVVEAARVADGASGNYVGTVTGGGIAILGGKSAVSNLSPETMAHELGHNMSLQHAPCGGAGGTDPFYPHANGATGAWGYDSDANSLVSPSMRDIMGYCYPFAWISDYHFNKSMNHRLLESSRTASPAAATAGKSLLVWGGADAEGEPQLHPAFVVDAPPTLPQVGGPFRLAGHDEKGRILFSMNFAMQEVADGDGGSSFVFAIPASPEWEETLHGITLTGPDGSATLGRDGDIVAALLRDPATGRVRGILHDWSEADVARAAAAAGQPPLSPQTGLDIQMSRGIPVDTAWRQ